MNERENKDLLLIAVINMLNGADASTLKSLTTEQKNALYYSLYKK